MARRFKAPSPVFSAADLRKELRRDQKSAQAAKIAKLRAEVARARRELTSATRKAKSDCLSDLRAKIARLTKEIADTRQRLHDARAEKRSTKVRSCSVAASNVRAQHLADLRGKRSALHDEISFRDHERRTERAARQRGEDKPKEFRQQSDAEVIYDLEAVDPRLVPIFKKIRRSIKGSRDMTRTEAFQEWASKHPEEIAAERAGSVPTDDQYAREMAEAFGQGDAETDVYLPHGVELTGDEVRRGGRLVGFLRKKAGRWRSSPYDYDKRLRVADFGSQQEALQDVLERASP